MAKIRMIQELGDIGCIGTLVSTYSISLTHACCAAPLLLESFKLSSQKRKKNPGPGWNAEHGIGTGTGIGRQGYEWKERDERKERIGTIGVGRFRLQVASMSILSLFRSNSSLFSFQLVISSAQLALVLPLSSPLPSHLHPVSDLLFSAVTNGAVHSRSYCRSRHHIASHR